MVTGHWPKQDIDHINGDKRDNRWKNLREATRSENNFNAIVSRRNTTGLRGVSKRYGNRWVAQIRIDGRYMWLGAFTTRHDANIAYMTAIRIFRKKFFRGRFEAFEAK
jgi:hypothetical protein